jgi:hypothetical protein
LGISILEIHFCEDLVEAVVVGGEGLTEGVEPLVDGVEGRFGESARAACSVDALLDEAGGLKHFEVAGDGGLGHLEWLGKFEDSSFAEGKTGKDGASGGIGQGGEAGVKIIHNRLVI